jgi:Domain of Unknown Function (DUF1080)
MCKKRSVCDSVAGRGPNNQLLGTRTQKQGKCGMGDWNDAILVARGNHITYSINGHVMTDLVDASRAALEAGRLALQLHEGYTMDIRYKEMRIKLLD